MSRLMRASSPVARDDQTWSPRPWAARLLKLGVLTVPLVASIAMSVAVANLLPRPDGAPGELLWWVAILSMSSLVLIAGEAFARKALPLVSLLRLSLLFPGRAPSRMGIARRSSRSELERLAEQVRTHGLGPDAEAAAITLVQLIAALDAHDRKTRGHSERVRMYTDLLAHRLRLDPDDANKLRWAALLHDIGKLSVPAEVLNKPGRLTDDEWELIHRHPADGDRMLGALREWLGPWALVVLEHHERWDGHGYPSGLAHEQISLGARLVAVADSYDVMTSVRSYQPQPRSPGNARDELVRCSGTQFDPGMVRCFLDISIRRLWWVLGPMAWILQVPVVGRALAAGVRRPSPAIGELGHVLACGIAVLALVPGIGSPGGGGLPPASAEAASARGVTAHGPAPHPIDPRQGVADQHPERGAAEPTPAAARPEPATTTSTTVAPAEGTATTQRPDAPEPTTVPPPPSVRPPVPDHPAPPPVPPATGNGDGNEDGNGKGDGHGRSQGNGYGHEKGRGKGHEHHDANGDGIDDKAGGATDRQVVSEAVDAATAVIEPLVATLVGSLVSGH